MNEQQLTEASAREFADAVEVAMFKALAAGRQPDTFAAMLYRAHEQERHDEYLASGAVVMRRAWWMAVGR